MWDIFGIKARRAAKKAEQERLEQERKEARKAFILKRKKIVKDYLEQKDLERWEKAQKLAEKDKQRVDRHNSTCPNCGSKNAVNKFVRLKGSLDGKLKGSSYGSHYSSLFGGGGRSCGSIDGSIHGEMDTIEVRECRDCGNQWEIEKPAHAFTGDYVNNPYSIGFEGEVDSLYRKIEAIVEDGKWPSDEPWCVRYFKDTPREVIEYLIFGYYFGYGGPHRWYRDDNEIETIFGIPATKDPEHLRPEVEGYEFQFTDELWDTIQKLIRRGPYVDFKYPKKDELDDL